MNIVLSTDSRINHINRAVKQNGLQQPSSIIFYINCRAAYIAAEPGKYCYLTTYRCCFFHCLDMSSSVGFPIGPTATTLINNNNKRKGIVSQIESRSY